MANDPNLSEALRAFHQYFSVVAAEDDDLRDRIFELRYQVYCLEHPFEDPADNPNGRETDAYDAHSAHAALIHNATGDLAGAVRLILPVAADPDFGLPALKCRRELRAEFADAARAGRVAEISRYAISKQFRRRRFEKLHADIGVLGAPSARKDERRLMPFLTLGLIRATYDLSRQHGIDHLLAVMDPLLLRLTGRMGLNFRTIGPLVDYHGLRQPCAASIAELRAAFSSARPDMFRVVADDAAKAQSTAA